MIEVIKPTKSNGNASLRVWFDPAIDCVVVDSQEPDSVRDFGTTMALTLGEADELRAALTFAIKERKA